MNLTRRLSLRSVATVALLCSAGGGVLTALPSLSRGQPGRVNARIVAGVEGIARAEGQSGSRDFDLTCNYGGQASSPYNYIAGGTPSTTQYINGPGLWCLTGELSWSSSGAPIEVTSNAIGAIIDLNGYAIRCTSTTCQVTSASNGETGVGDGIFLQGGNHLQVQNGMIQGFGNGLWFGGTTSAMAPTNVLVKDVFVSGYGVYGSIGAHIWWGSNINFEGCEFMDLPGYGIWADEINGNYTIHDNLFHMHSGIDVELNLVMSGTSGYALVDNNLFMGGGSAIDCSSGSNVKWVNNTQRGTTNAYANCASSWTDSTGTNK